MAKFIEKLKKQSPDGSWKKEFAKTIEQWKTYQNKKGKAAFDKMLENLEEDGGDFVWQEEVLQEFEDLEQREEKKFEDWLKKNTNADGQEQ